MGERNQGQREPRKVSQHLKTSYRGLWTQDFPHDSEGTGTPHVPQDQSTGRLILPPGVPDPPRLPGSEGGTC